MIQTSYVVWTRKISKYKVCNLLSGSQDIPIGALVLKSLLYPMDHQFGNTSQLELTSSSGFGDIQCLSNCFAHKARLHITNLMMRLYCFLK